MTPIANKPNESSETHIAIYSFDTGVDNFVDSHIHFCLHAWALLEYISVATCSSRSLHLYLISILFVVGY